MGKIIALIIIAIPFVLTVWNIFALIQYLVRKIDKSSYKVIEVIAMFTGILYVFFYSDISNIVFVNWDVKLYHYKLSSMFYPDTFFTMGTILLIAFLGYILIRFIPAVKQSPMVSAVGISAVYLGIGICALWFTKTIRDFFLIFLTVNCIIIFFKTIYILVYQKNTFFQNGTTTIKYGKLSSILNKAANLPWIALILAIPLLGIIIAVQPLMGQIIALIILAIPFALTAWNIFALIKYLVKKKEKKYING